jgi:tetratricopeptide (TPR) repeat protein
VLRRAAPFVAGGSALAIAMVVLTVAAAPILTADFWWHLAMGERYASLGPLLTDDPLSHTARAAPDPHEWLFDVALFGLQRAVGFHGLRALHALAVLGILALATSIFLREARGWTAACAAAAFWAVLAWYRLIQLRPDLVSIGAMLLVHRLLLEPGAPPSWRRVAASAGIFGVWANAHALFGVGLVLVATALAGVLLRGLAARLQVGEAGSGEAALARRLAAALAACALATLANPSGPGAHLTFFRASSGIELWRIGDEWAPFRPFSWTHDPGGMSWLTWLAADALLAAWLLAALLGGVRLLRRRDRESLHAVDPMLFALGAASVAAIGMGQRFLWLGVFPLLGVLRALAPLRARREAPLAAALAAAALALALAFPGLGGVDALLRHLPSRPADYLREPWLPAGQHVEGVRFLREAGLEGNLFNAYANGGFLGYWLAPRLRTFVDGRLNVPSAVLHEYFAIVSMSGLGTGESWLDLLEQRRVDVFFGVGAPTSSSGHRARTYTAGHLERQPGWLLVSRSIEHAIYLRRNERNRANLERVRAWYAGQGVPFDAEVGLDPGRVIAERPDWAIERGMLPQHHPRTLRAAESADPTERYRALGLLGFVYTLLGAWPEAIRADAGAAALRPAARGPRLRLANAYLRLGRAEEALAASRELLRIDPRDERARLVAMLARELARLGLRPDAPPPAALGPALAQLPVVNPADVARLRRSMVRPRLEP